MLLQQQHATKHSTHSNSPRITNTSSLQVHSIDEVITVIHRYLPRKVTSSQTTHTVDDTDEEYDADDESDE